jgi:hypothetical protein
MSEYDPKTCITAGEMREIGFGVPAQIPDCAWIPRSAFDLDWEVTCGPSGGDNSLSAKVTVKVNEPFRWIRLEFTVEPEK